MGYGTKSRPVSLNGSDKLEPKLERLAVLLSAGHRKHWTAKTVASEFGWTEETARRNLSRSEVQARAAFLGRQEVKRLGLYAMGMMKRLLAETKNENLKFKIAQDLMDRAGFAHDPTPPPPPAFSFNFMLGPPGGKTIDGNVDRPALPELQPAEPEAAEEWGEGFDAPGGPARTFDD